MKFTDKEWAKMSSQTGICLKTLKSRYNKLGWSLEKTLTTPVRDKSGKARKSLENGNITYIGTPCKHCGGTIKYSKNHMCVNTWKHRYISKKNSVMLTKEDVNHIKELRFKYNLKLYQIANKFDVNIEYIKKVLNDEQN